MEGGLERRQEHVHTKAEEVYAQKEAAGNVLRGNNEAYAGMAEHLQTLIAEYEKLTKEYKEVDRKSAAGLLLSERIEDLEDEMLELEQALNKQAAELDQSQQQHPNSSRK